MKVHLDANDLKEFLWLQELVFDRLSQETLRRASPAGHLPEGHRF